MRFTLFRPNGSTREFYNFRAFNLWFTNTKDLKGTVVHLNGNRGFKAVWYL